MIALETNYNDLLNRLSPFLQSSNKIEKRAARDFSIVIKCYLNKDNSPTLAFLHDAIDHVFKHFDQEFTDLIDNKIVSQDMIYSNVHYDLLNDISTVLLQTIFHKKNLEDLRQFLLQI